MFVMLARMYVCRGDHLFRCSQFYVPKLKTREHSGSGQSNGASVCAFSSHAQARADRFIKHLPLRKACTTWVVKFEKLFHTLGTHWTSSPKRACTSCATFCFVRCKMHDAFLTLFCPALALVCLVCFFPRCLFTFLDCPWGRPFGAPVSCSDHVYIKYAEIFGTRKEDLPQVSIQFAQKIVAVSELTSSRCCFAHGVPQLVSFSLVMLGYLSRRVSSQIAASTRW